MKKLRQTVQLALLLLFVSFILWPERSPGDLLFQLDPVTTGLAQLGSWAWTSAAIFVGLLLLFTVLVGRVFCGWACPLGTLSDLVDWVVGRAPRLLSLRRVKYYLLLIFVVLAAGGVALAWALDPLSWASRILDALGPRQLELGVVVGVTMIFLLVLVAFGRRAFCRLLCPLGALLAVLSRFALFRREVDEERCTGCDTCVDHCRMAAIGQELSHLRSECVHCRECDAGCEASAVRFSYLRPTRPDLPELSRRGTLVALAGGTAAVLLRIGVAPARTGRTLLRPPGSVDEETFVDLCIRCGACMRVCPPGILMPARLAGGLLALESPVPVFRRGGCLHDCNSCGQVCPTGAISPLPLSEKRRFRIGEARIDEQRCLPHAHKAPCVVCLSVCPFEAIHLTRGKDKTAWGELMPLVRVDAEKCTGCGLCEAACPLPGRAAIEVIPSRSLRPVSSRDGSPSARS